MEQFAEKMYEEFRAADARFDAANVPFMECYYRIRLIGTPTVVGTALRLASLVTQRDFETLWTDQDTARYKQLANEFVDRARNELGIHLPLPDGDIPEPTARPPLPPYFVPPERPE